MNYSLLGCPTTKALNTPTKEAIKTMVYPVGKSIVYESIIETMISTEPISHEKGKGLNLLCINAKKAGTMSSTKTTSTPASCTDEVTVSAKRLKKRSSLAMPESL